MCGAYQHRPDLNYTDCFFFFCLWSSSNTVDRCKQATEEYLLSHVPILYIHISREHCRQPNCTHMWGCDFTDREGVTHAHVSAYLLSRMCEYKHCNKSRLEHMFCSPSQWRLSSPHVPSDRHAHTCSGKHRDEGRGFLTSWPRPAGAFWSVARANWAFGVYCLRNGPTTYREINPHFISHICSTAPK